MKTWDEALAKLKDLKNKSNLSFSQIAAISNVPISTLTRIFSNQTTNPSITTVIDIVKALGGDVSDIFSGEFRKEIKNGTPEQKEIIEEVIKKVEQTEKNIFHNPNSDEFKPCPFHEATVTHYESSIKKYEKWAKALFICNLFIISAILIILLLDILNSNIGYIR